MEDDEELPAWVRHCSRFPWWDLLTMSMLLIIAVCGIIGTSVTLPMVMDIKHDYERVRNTGIVDDVVATIQDFKATAPIVRRIMERAAPTIESFLPAVSRQGQLLNATVTEGETLVLHLVRSFLNPKERQHMIDTIRGLLDRFDKLIPAPPTPPSPPSAKGMDAQSPKPPS